MDEQEKNLVQYDEVCGNCVWFACWACDGKFVGSECSHGIIFKDDMSKYNMILQKYEEDCQKALVPVNEQYHNMFVEYSLDHAKLKTITLEDA